MKKILIIEDDPAFAELLRAKLSEKYRVEICEDGQSGYYTIYEYKPDAVLLDLTIAQMDAVSLVSKMRAQKQFQKLPIFVLADAKTAGRADDALEYGANEAFLKEENASISSIVSALSALLTPSLTRKAVVQSASVARAEHAAAPAKVLAGSSDTFATVAPSPPEERNRVSSSSLASLERMESFFQTSRLDPPDYLADILTDQDVPMRQIHQFLDGYGRKAHAVRQEFIRYRTANEIERPGHLGALLEKISGLNNDAIECGLVGLSRFLSVIEWRIHQLCESRGPNGPATLQGIASALDVVTALNNHLDELEPLNHFNPLALIVDDDQVSRKTVCLGLEKAKVKTTAVDNPYAALLEAESKPFDLIFLDVDLPGMNGFALCARLRIIPSHRKTPILFVTSLNDIKSRASSRVSGGNDFITKPINLYELGINAWSLIVTRRVLGNATRVRT